MQGIILQLAQVFETLGTCVDELARECGWIRRERVISGSQFVQTLVFSWWQNPQATWEDIAENARLWFDVDISPQALHARVGEPLWRLLTALSERLLAAVVTSEPSTVPILSRFSAVLLHDSTTIRLSEALSDLFPGGGNQHQNQAAAMKLLAQWNVLAGNLSAAQFAGGRTADTALGARLPEPPPDALLLSLLLCDRGFFDLDALRQWQAAGAFFVVRPLTGALVATGQTAALQPLQPLPEWLRSQPAGADQLDMPVLLTAERFACRLLAMRCSADMAAQRRRKLRRTCRRKGQTPSRDQLVMCEWFVLITNVPPARLTIEEALVVYRVRWPIELLFKSYKSESGLHTSRARTGWGRLVELGAKWLARLLEHHLLTPTGGPLSGVSWLKRIRRVTRWAGQIVRHLHERDALTNTLKALMQRLRALPKQRRRKKHPSTRELLDNPRLITNCLT